MLKTKYKIPNTNTEIDAIYIQQSYVLDNQNRIATTFKVYDETIGIEGEPIAEFTRVLHSGTPEFDAAFSAIIRTLDSMSEASLLTQPGFEQATQENRVIIPTYTEEI